MGRLIIANQAVVVIGAMLQVLLGREGRKPSSGRVAECLLGWSLPLNVGLMGIFFFLGHTARAKEVAEELGWPAGNPFQTEVAFANLFLRRARSAVPALAGTVLVGYRHRARDLYA